MSELVEFIKARLDEREQAEHRKRRLKHHIICPREGCYSESSVLGSRDSFVTFEPCNHTMPNAEFWDQFSDPIPDKDALKDIEFKRKLLALHTPEPREPETDAQLHARLAHPEWEYEITEGPRKTWDDYDVPPRDENGDPDHTWERNLDAGYPGEGWERGDYTEHSYWRRRLPADKVRGPYIPAELKFLATLYDWHPDYKETWQV